MCVFLLECFVLLLGDPTSTWGDNEEWSAPKIPKGPGTGWVLPVDKSVGWGKPQVSFNLYPHWFCDLQLWSTLTLCGQIMIIII